MSKLCLLLSAAALTACVESEKVGGVSETAGEGGPVEEEHLVILDDCGLSLSCDPMRVVIDVFPPEALDCAQALHGDAQPGLLQVFWEPDGAEIPYADLEEAYLLTADRRTIRQRRELACPECGADSSWAAWGPHEICEISSTFDPSGNVQDCQPVDDFTCDDLLALLAEEPEPSVPCEERPMEECDGPLDAETQCTWREIPNYSGESCEPNAIGACVGGRAVGLECELNPTCEGAGTEGVFFREREDGSVDIFTGDDCYMPVGFERCSWGEPGSEDPPGMLEVGPPACDCACSGP